MQNKRKGYEELAERLIKIVETHQKAIQELRDELILKSAVGESLQGSLMQLIPHFKRFFFNFEGDEEELTALLVIFILGVYGGMKPHQKLEDNSNILVQLVLGKLQTEKIDDKN